MWTKDSRGFEIEPGDVVTWNDPPHLGGAPHRGLVLEPVKGGWFRVQELDPAPKLLKPSSLTVTSP